MPNLCSICTTLSSLVGAQPISVREGRGYWWEWQEMRQACRRKETVLGCCPKWALHVGNPWRFAVSAWGMKE
ncbi:hypothetical protein LZ31DRAFT_379194 [Colletotrichum somersetense]|nr:hypothetical protein LZ31DRAFT_379194 [Colletotrichum somersetense]